MYVMMPVHVADEYCRECPHLDIGVDRDVITYSIDSMIRAENNLFCKNYDNCLRSMKSKSEHASRTRP